MNLAVLAASGWGKSYALSALTERNIPQYDRVVVLDYKGEYRGLCSKEHGPAPATHWQAGNVELHQFGSQQWQSLVEDNDAVVVERNGHHLNNEDWREVCAAVIRAARAFDGSVLVVIDEAHFVAPEGPGFPDEIKGLATTGRGEQTSAMWCSQRPSAVSKDILGNCEARFLGGFEDGNDLDAIRKVVEYPVDVHKTGGHPVPGLPAELHADDEGAISVRKWAEVTDDGTRQTVDSEWIYSDSSGESGRLRSAERWDPACSHVGAAGKNIDVGLRG